jgi:hypothetical protein
MERLGVGGVAMGNIVAGAMVAAGRAVVGLASSSLDVAAQFQNATATFASVAGGALAAAGVTLDDVKNKALEMGAQTQFSAAQAQEAMINLAKGGVPIADIMRARARPLGGRRCRASIRSQLPRPEPDLGPDHPRLLLGQRCGHEL